MWSDPTLVTILPADDDRRVHSREQVLVYGASGHTGRFVTAELRRRGLVPVLSGRDPATLAAAGPPGLDRRPAPVDDPDALDAALAGTAAVINCAGPFRDTAVAVAEAALRAGAHYLDVSAEQASVEALRDGLDASARAAGLAVVPATAFYGGLADLLATAVLDGGPTADEITVAIGLDRWWPTEGTRDTGRRATGPRLVVSGGRLVPLPDPPPTRTWAFPDPFGPQDVVAIAFSEIVLMAAHLPVPEIRTVMNLAPLRDVRDPATPPPRPVDGTGRSAQRFVVEVVARTGTGERRIAVGGQDIYAVTAPIVVEAAVRLLDGRATAAGVVSPGEAFDARDVLDALSPDPLTILRSRADPHRQA